MQYYLSQRSNYYSQPQECKDVSKLQLRLRSLGAQDIFSQAQFNKSNQPDVICFTVSSPRILANIEKDYFLDKAHQVLPLWFDEEGYKVFDEITAAQRSLRDNPLESVLIKAYATTILWLHTYDPESDFEDFDIESFSDEAIKRCQVDCSTFLGRVKGVLTRYIAESRLKTTKVLITVMHDFWYTRNNLDPNFCDGDYAIDGKTIYGGLLFREAIIMDKVSAYKGSDGRIYLR